MATDPRLAKITNDYIKELQKVGTGRTNAQKLLVKTAPITDFGKMSVDHPEERNPGFGSRVLDVISRPLYAVANVVNETEKSLEKIGHDTGLKASQKDSNGQDFQAGMDPFTAAWRGLSGQDKTTFRDVIDTSETDTSKVNTAVKGVGGLALDIALDPSNLAFGAAAKAVGALRGKKAVSAVEDARQALNDTNLTRVVTGLETPKPVPEVPPTLPSPEAVAAPAEHLPINNTPRPASAPKVVDSVGQTDIVKTQVTENSQKIKKAGLLPEDHALLMDAATTPKLRAHFDGLASKGIYPEIKAADGSKYSLSVADVLESIPQQARLDLQYMPPGHPNLYTSQWAAGAAEALRLDAMGVAHADRIPQVMAAMKSATAPGAIRASFIEASGNLQRGAETLVDSTGTLYDKLLENAKKFDQKDLIDAQAIGKTKAENLLDSLENGPTSRSINEVASVGSDIQKMAREAGATDNAAIHAVHDIAPIVAKVATESDTAMAQAAKAVARNNTKLAATAAAAKNQQRIARLAPIINQSAEDLAKQLDLPTVTLGEKADLQINSWLDKLMNPVRNKFKFGAGSGEFASMMRAGDGAAESWALKYRGFLGTIDKAHAKPDIQAAFSALKRGVAPADPKVLAAYNDVEKALDHIFDTQDGLLGRLFRNGATVEELNKHLKEFGVPHRFIEKAGGKDAKMAEIANQWRNWDISDPLAEFEKINAAIQRVEAKQAVGQVFSKQFGSTVPKPGYVRVSANELSAMGNHVNKTLFYPKEAAEQFKRLDEILRSETSFRGNKGGIAAFANNVLDPIMRMWKPSVTIIRPGHHIRNLISDIVLGAFDDVMSVRHYTAAKNMMSAGGALKREGIEGIDSIFTGALKSGHNKMMTVTLKNGKKVDLSVDGGYQLASRNGILQSHFYTEDFMERGGKILDAVMNSLPLRAAGKVSELNGHFTRLAHFHRLMEDASFTRKFSSLEEAALAASERVRKFHPDVKGLTPFETKYMRRLIPFYSWIRQAIPVVLQTMVIKPGRVAAVPKMQYNLAVATGQDPDSLSNPFPTDKLYPSFITDNLTGPVFGSLGMNLGTPAEGVLGDIANGNPARNILGMLNPVLKAPIDLVSGTNIGTGAHIPDKGEYIDQLLPGVNQVAAISGYSPTGSVAGLTLDPQRAVVKGEKDHLWNLQLANFLSGLGLTETEKPSFTTIAGKEKSQQ